MKNFVAFMTAVIGIVVTPCALHAQTGRIVKAAGRRAIIQFPEGTQLRVGDTVKMGSGPSRGLDSVKRADEESRANLLGLSASIKSLSKSAGNSTSTETTVAFSFSYGWNMGQMEYGPYGAFSTTSNSATGGGTTSLEVGGFFDYNLEENKPGVEMVYGFGGRAGLGQSKQDNVSASLMNFFGGGFAKWFPLGNSTAIRGDAGLEYDRLSVSGVAATAMGFKATGSLVVYF